MGWIKNRDKLYEASISSIKAIAKNKDLTSKNGIPQRPPVLDQASLSSTPRSTKDLSTWRGESDFQAFWFAYHKPIKEIPLTLPARLVFNELEMSRVEIIGSSDFKGSKTNIIDYLEAKSLSIEDQKSPNYTALCANLWLKDAAGITLLPASQKILNNFNEKFASANLFEIKEDIVNTISNQENFSKLSEKFLKKINLLKIDNSEEDLNEEEPFESPGSTNEIEQGEMEDQQDNDSSDPENMLEDMDIAMDDNIQQVESTSDGTSIDEEIEALAYPENNYTTNGQQDYSIFTSAFDEIIDAKDLTTSD